MSRRYAFTGTLPVANAPAANALLAISVDEPAGLALFGAAALAGLGRRRRG